MRVHEKKSKKTLKHPRLSTKKRGGKTYIICIFYSFDNVLKLRLQYRHRCGFLFAKLPSFTSAMQERFLTGLQIKKKTKEKKLKNTLNYRPKNEKNLPIL